MPVGDSPLQLTLDAKAAIQLSFEDLGGTDWLIEWANEPGNLCQFYTQIWSKIIPKDVKTENTFKNVQEFKAELVHSLKVSELDDDELVLLEKLTQKALDAPEH